MKSQTTPRRILTIGSVITLALFYLLQAWQITATLVDVPHRDDWQLLSSSLRDSSLPLEWLFQTHNEHFILSTKILVLALYKLNAWDVSVHLMLNFVLFSLLLLLVLRICLKPLSRETYWLAYLSFIFPLSTLNWENHLWAFQTSIHSSLLFLGLCCWLTSSTRSRTGFLLGGICAIAAPLCFSAAYAASSAVALFLLVETISSRSMEQRGFRILLSCLVFFATIAIFFSHFDASGEAIARAVALPHEKRFWQFLLNAISLGFGIETFSDSLGLLCASFCVIALCSALRQRAGVEKWQENRSALMLLTAVLASLVAIAIGRGSQADIEIWSKGSRYYEIASLLVPLCVSLLCANLRHISRSVMLFGVFLTTTIAHHNNYSFTHYYWTAEQKLEGRQCAVEFLFSNSQETCRSIWGMGTNDELLRAKQLKLSFLNKATQQK